MAEMLGLAGLVALLVFGANGMVAQAGATEETLQFGRFGALTLYHPSAQPIFQRAQVVLRRAGIPKPSAPLPKHPVR